MAGIGVQDHRNHCSGSRNPRSRSRNRCSRSRNRCSRWIGISVQDGPEYAGYGARSGIADVIALADTLNCPVLTTFKAKGLISDAHPLGAGVLGRSGTPVASGFMNQADLLITFGASFSAHTGIATNKPIIQVDFDRMLWASSMVWTSRYGGTSGQRPKSFWNDLGNQRANPTSATNSPNAGRAGGKRNRRVRNRTTARM